MSLVLAHLQQCSAAIHIGCVRCTISLYYFKHISFTQCTKRSMNIIVSSRESGLNLQKHTQTKLLTLALMKECRYGSMPGIKVRFTNIIYTAKTSSVSLSWMLMHNYYPGYLHFNKAHMQVYTLTDRRTLVYLWVTDLQRSEIRRHRISISTCS